MANNAETVPNPPALLLTRPRERALHFLNSLDQAALSGVQVVISPLIDIVPLTQLPRLGDAAGVIFTSVHGVAFAPPGSGLPTYCVGERTAQAARQAGWDVQMTAQTADDLVALVSAAAPPLVHFAGRHRRGDVAKRLNSMGIPTRIEVVYDQRLRDLSGPAKRLLVSSKRVIVPLFSPRTAAQFMSQSKGATRVEIVAISTAVAKVVPEEFRGQVHVAQAPTGLEMRRCVELRLRDTSLA